MNGLSLFAPLGRLLLAVLFIGAGVSKISGFDGTADYIAAYGLPMPSVLAVLTIVLEIGAGIAILVGYQTRIAAFLLAGFTLLAGIIFHAYWAVPADQAYMQQLLFMKNVSIAGGLLLLVAMGAGAWSVDQRQAQSTS